MENLIFIKKWTGCNKQYFEAIDFLAKNKRITSEEEKTLRKGLNCYRESIVNIKMSAFKKELENNISEAEKIEIVEETINNSVSDLKIESPAEFGDTFNKSKKNKKNNE